jgi:transposase
MRAFSTEISGNRVRNSELSENQRTFIISKAEAGVRTKEIADDLGCSQSCVQKTIKRYNLTGSTASHPRIGRPRKISRRLHR